jgi:hypothetical protein
MVLQKLQFVEKNKNVPKEPICLCLKGNDPTNTSNKQYNKTNNTTSNKDTNWKVR